MVSQELISHKHISVIGLGKLGIPIAVALASKGYTIYGVDTNQKVIDAINNKTISLHELQFDTLFKKYGHNIIATTDYKRALRESDISFIIVPTPSKKSGLFDNRYIKKVIQQIAPLLAQKSNYHLINIVSTVVPGSMDKEIKPLLEKQTGKIVGKDIGLCYNPAFIALGTVIKNFLNPDFVLIGQSDNKAGDILEKLYRKTCTHKPTIKRMNYVNAEITKLALNTFVTTKISYANMLAELCESLPSAHVDIVTDALGADTRIGKKYLKGATAYGGPCFPRDNKALSATGKRVGLTLNLPQATDTINTHQIKRLISLLKKKTPHRGTIAILGMNYQSGSDVIEESVGIKLAYALKDHFQVRVYDPLSSQNAQKVLGNTVFYANNLKQALQNTNSICITINDTKFALRPTEIPKTRPFLVDCWRTINSPQVKKMVKYYALGIGQTK